MKNRLISILNLAINFVECCNEYSNDYVEEEKRYKELLDKIEKDDYQDFSEEEKSILVDACNNAVEELEMSVIDYSEEYYNKINEIVEIQSKLKK